jgi:hypothetical protein
MELAEYSPELVAATGEDGSVAALDELRPLRIAVWDAGRSVPGASRALGEAVAELAGGVRCRGRLGAVASPSARAVRAPQWA